MRASESSCVATIGVSRARTAPICWPEVGPEPGDVVFVKKKPSAFLGTPLLPYLVDRKIDTLVIVGGATSNCVRATVFDSASYNFRTIVPADAVFDRLAISHAISLFDMDRQFADVRHSRRGDLGARATATRSRALECGRKIARLHHLRMSVRRRPDGE